MARTNSTGSKDSSANLGFEAKLWLTADKLRNNMDAAEYKHVVLGLIFLKYISDTFEEHRAKLNRGASRKQIPISSARKECVASRPGCGSLGSAFEIMNKPKIIAYLKPSCGWSQGVRAIMRKYDLPFEDRDIINDPVQRQEMIEKSGQMLSPCVEIEGRMLPDISGEEVEAFLLANRLVGTTDKLADAPTNQPCAHEMPQSAPLAFRR